MTSRRRFLVCCTLAALLPPSAVSAQKRTVKVGILSPRPLSESVLTPHIVKRLEELG